MVKAKPRCNAATHIPKVIFSAKPSEECSVDEIVKKKFTKHQEGGKKNLQHEQEGDISRNNRVRNAITPHHDRRYKLQVPPTIQQSHLV